MNHCRCIIEYETVLDTTYDVLLWFHDRSRVSMHGKSRNKGERGSLIAKSRTITEEPEHKGSFISYISGFN